MKFFVLKETGDPSEFFEFWSARYRYALENKYEENIGKPLTENSRTELFEWKNGSKLSGLKMQSVVRNYPLVFQGDLEARYLNPEKPGGPVWNIFYLHCLDQVAWPIFDQHTYRSMVYLMKGHIKELPENKTLVYTVYCGDYIPFFNSFWNIPARTRDRALFAFGKFLKQ